MCVNLHVADWVTDQQEDPILKTMIIWISYQKVQDLGHLLEYDTNTEEGMASLQEQNNLLLCQGAFHHCHTLAGELKEAM